ncbi:hypothetical protein VTN00DRAFT_5056 [Thermoascus crustaceus]|uniref:uncharacterized protein n=1 Tax=Thermoascus crustaceus TaxID=5088 RepID=UPI0037429DEE
MVIGDKTRWLALVCVSRKFKIIANSTGIIKKIPVLYLVDLPLWIYSKAFTRSSIGLPKRVVPELKESKSKARAGGEGCSILDHGTISRSSSVSQADISNDFGSDPKEKHWPSMSPHLFSMQYVVSALAINGIPIGDLGYRQHTISVERRNGTLHQQCAVQIPLTLRCEHMPQTSIHTRRFP